MLTLAGVLFMTTLVTNALTKELPVVRHECGDKSLCHIKPADYPQEEIDEMAFKYLRHLHKTKREALEKLEAAPPAPGGNCETVTISSPVYTLRDSNMAPQYIVQSKWFSQHVPQVQCKNEKSPCFTGFVTNSDLAKHTGCKTNRVTTSLVVFDQILKKPVKVHSTIDISCDCVLRYD